VSISIRDALLPGGRRAAVHVDGNRIVEIGPPREADVTIDALGKALLPGFVNTHTHAAMTLFRGYADDMELQSWLSAKIWPAEARLTPDMAYWGTKLACLEMIKSGTTSFNDMYFFMDHAARAVDEMGIRAVLSEGFIDLFHEDRAEEELRKTRTAIDRISSMRNPRITPAVGPHAVYTVSESSLRALRAMADERACPFHIHVSETKGEVEGARKDHGKTPAAYLDAIGVLGPRVVAAHSVWLEEAEIATFARRGVAVAHCPVSNMKLAVGRAMPLAAMQRAGVTVSLGTDGAASNNRLDMFESMKLAALLHKFAADSATVAPAAEVFDMATRGGARALGLDAGSIEVGKLADVILVDLHRPEMTPSHNLVSNLVYAATGDCVDTVICDGRVVMEGRRVRGEIEILAKAGEIAANLVGGAS